MDADITLPPFLKQDLSRVRTTRRCWIHPTRLGEPDLITVGFFQHLRKNYTSFDVLTYSCTGCQGLKIKRLVTGLHCEQFDGVAMRHAENLHSKLFLCYRKRRLVDAYVGSQNLVAPTTLNIMLRASPKARKLLKEYFEQVWKDLE